MDPLQFSLIFTPLTIYLLFLIGAQPFFKQFGRKTLDNTFVSRHLYPNSQETTLPPS